MSTGSNQSKLSLPVLVTGFLLGLFLSWSLISGDEQGRVNLLQLVAIYVFLPIFSLLFSTISLFIGKSWNFAKSVSLIPIWSKEQQNQFLKLTQSKHAKLIFFYQSQLAALSFSVASLLVLVLLLVSSDVNFVWRSTLLDAEQLFPILDWLAIPWRFWLSAQPSLDLLQTTQDSRLLQQNAQGSHFGDWWTFILATQVFYAFFLRFMAIIFCRLYLKIANQKPDTIQLSHSKQAQTKMTADVELVKPVNNITSNFALNNWCGLRKNLLQDIERRLEYKKTSELNAGPLASHAEQMVAERWQENQLLIVKSWEPPLAELADFMQNGKGYLLPLDWNDDGLQALEDVHLNEWRRFIFQLPNWQLLLLEDL